MTPQQLDVLQYVLKVRVVGAAVSHCMNFWWGVENMAFRLDGQHNQGNHRQQPGDGILTLSLLQEVDDIADATLAVSRPDDVLGPADPRLVKRWSAVGAAKSLSPSHHKLRLRHLSAMPAGGRRQASKGGVRDAGPLCC